MKQHMHIQKCHKCKSSFGYEIATIACEAKVVLFLTCEICGRKHALIWSNGVRFTDPNQTKMFDGPTNL